ncbi:MAG: hypothetical protein AABM32_06545 [Chloroflexota bacterium]
MEPGLYLTFFNEGEPFDAELPPVGPLDRVVVRERSLVADRKDGQEADHFGGGGRWIEAESELRRATGKEPGGAKRSDLRIAAPEGVYLRFVSFGVAAEQDTVPELGPYAVVVVGKRGVEADGDSLATRRGSNGNLWELTGVGGSAFVGLSRPDIAFRTRSTVYHPETKLVRAAPPPVQAPPRPVAAPPRVAAAPRPPEEALLTLRDRIGSEPSTSRSGYTTMRPEAEQREWGGAAWRLRFGIIGALVVLIAVFSVPSIRSALSGGGSTQATVGVGTAVTSPDWSYNVGSVRRMTKIGAAQPRGTFLVVQVGVTNRGRAGAQLVPGSFTLATGTGEQYAASATNSGVYSGQSNTDSAYIWPAEFPVGRQVVIPLIFDVNPSVSGTELVIFDLPTTRVRLE